MSVRRQHHHNGASPPDQASEHCSYTVSSSAVNSSLFHLLCQDSDAEHEELLIHTEVCYSHEKMYVVPGVKSPREEMVEFLFLSGKDNLRFSKIISLTRI